MNPSLREQLLAAGLVTKKQVDQADQAHLRVQRQQKQTSKAPAPKPKSAAQKAEEEKAARDRELNRKKEEKAARRARAVAINQLVEQQRIPRVEAENPEFYNFVDGGKIHRIAIVSATREKIMRGELMLARYRGFYALVPKDTALRIRAIDANAVIEFKAESPPQDQNDPYKDFAVPDDLQW